MEAMSFTSSWISWKWLAATTEFNTRLEVPNSSKSIKYIPKRPWVHGVQRLGCSNIPYSYCSKFAYDMLRPQPYLRLGRQAAYHSPSPEFGAISTRCDIRLIWSFPDYGNKGVDVCVRVRCKCGRRDQRRQRPSGHSSRHLKTPVRQVLSKSKIQKNKIRTSDLKK